MRLYFSINRRACILGTSIFFLGYGVSANAKDLTRGQIIATTCFTCHGDRGVSPGQIPSINDLSAERIERTLKEFKESKRASTVMGRHASGYTDEELVDAANYIASINKGGK
jgi:cytochrome subunit of sulfide dehydrogenase